MDMNPEYNDVDYVNALNAKRAEAARINGAKSQGPKTEEGKAVSSQNAIKHGLRSKKIVLKDEDPQEFDAFSEGMLKSLHPETDDELMLAIKIVECSWRLRRIADIEAELFNDCLENEQKLHDAFIDNGSNLRFSTINRYEVSLNNQLFRAMQELARRQDKRKLNERTQELHEAELALLNKRTQLLHDAERAFQNERTQTDNQPDAVQHKQTQAHNANLHKRTQQRTKKQKQNKQTQRVSNNYGIWNKPPEPTDQN